MAADSSTSAQRRRATKPLIEKRRRARINSSLAQLKEIVPIGKQESRSNRLEKADILELTVEYVRRLHGGKSAVRDNSVEGRPEFRRFFKEGYRLCMTEVQKFFSDSNCHHQQQSPKQFLHRSLQSYLEKTLRDTAKSLCFGADSEEPSPTRCPSRQSTSLDAVPFVAGSDRCEFHSESSNFSHSYSTDDEMTENCSASEAESNVRSKDFNLLQDKRTPSHHDAYPAQDRMWRPW